MNNPAVAGDVQFDTFIYGAPPLLYPAPLSQYTIYNTPDPAFITGRINVSGFANLGASTPWPFANTNVPLNDGTGLKLPAAAAPAATSKSRGKTRKSKTKKSQADELPLQADVLK